MFIKTQDRHNTASEGLLPTFHSLIIHIFCLWWRGVGAYVYIYIYTHKQHNISQFIHTQQHHIKWNTTLSFVPVCVLFLYWTNLLFQKVRNQFVWHIRTTYQVSVDTISLISTTKSQITLMSVYVWMHGICCGGAKNKNLLYSQWLKAQCPQSLDTNTTAAPAVMWKARRSFSWDKTTPRLARSLSLSVSLLSRSSSCC